MENGYYERIMESMFSDREVTCAQCGKQFIRPVDTQYKVSFKDSSNNKKTLYFCRYNHYVQWMKDHGRW